MNINTYKMKTTMGNVSADNGLPFPENIIEKICDIGCRQSSNRIEKWTKLLNDISEHKQYKIEQTKFDDGEFVEGFDIIEVIK